MQEPPGPSRYMRRALALARGALGRTSPNPAVGAVLVKDGAIVGEGATQPPGGAHAEIMAIRDAGARATGATLYVTLEPCSTRGRTEPCTDAIQSAGIDAVVLATGDADPQADGRGIARLREAGITVTAGDGAEAATRHYEAYTHHRRCGRPFVIAKFAASLDGKIAATGGDSRWVSGPETREWAHRLRATLDAILVGIDTILIDDPQLTARPTERSTAAPQPLRVVLDSRGRTPAAARVLRDQGSARTLIVTTAAAPAGWCAEIEATGATVLSLPAQADGRVALPPLLDVLAQDFGVLSLLVEGGGGVHGAFADQRLINKVHAVIAPMIIGGDAAPAVRGRGAERMADVLRLRDVSVDRLGDDLLITGYPVVERPLGEISLRPAVPEDAPALTALVPDPAQREVAAGALDRLFAQVARGQAGCWAALHRGAIVGGVGVAYTDDEVSTIARGGGIALLLLAPDWRRQALTGRLLEAAEASAGGRGLRWLTTELGRGQNAVGWSRAEWARRGYRYLRRSREGYVVLIKDLGPTQ